MGEYQAKRNPPPKKNRITYCAAVALGAVLAMLAGAVLAGLARSDGAVVLGRALAAVVDGLADKPAGIAGERVGAAALEQADTGGRLGRGAACHAGAVSEERAVAADPAGVAGGNTVAPVTSGVQAPTASAGLGPTLDPAALAGNGGEATAGLNDPVAVAR